MGHAHHLARYLAVMSIVTWRLFMATLIARICLLNFNFFYMFTAEILSPSIVFSNFFPIFNINAISFYFDSIAVNHYNYTQQFVIGLSLCESNTCALYLPN